MRGGRQLGVVLLYIGRKAASPKLAASVPRARGEGGPRVHLRDAGPGASGPPLRWTLPGREYICIDAVFKWGEGDQEASKLSSPCFGRSPGSMPK